MKPLSKGIIEAIAKLDVLIALQDAEDQAALWDWCMTEGADVSPTAKALLLSSIMHESQSPSTITKKDSHQ